MNNLSSTSFNMLEKLIDADRKLFSLINQAHDPVVDFLMYWATDKWIWIPFYIWILYIIIINYGWKTIYVLLITATMITISDQVSVALKDSVQRLRPCHDPYFNGIIHLVNNECGGNFGFVSSHASNTMTLAIFIAGTLPISFRWLKVELFAYVLLVCYSRVYLGAHFPGDIIGGWMLGIAVGVCGVFIFRKINSIKKI